MIASVLTVRACLSLFCRHPSGAAAAHLRREAAGGRAHPGRLQHPEGVDAAPGPSPPRRRQEAQEEDVHRAQEGRPRAQERRARRRAREVPGRRGGGEGGEAAQGVPQPGVRARGVHGGARRPTRLRQVRPHLRRREPERGGAGRLAS